MATIHVLQIYPILKHADRTQVKALEIDMFVKQKDYKYYCGLQNSKFNRV